MSSFYYYYYTAKKQCVTFIFPENILWRKQSNKKQIASFLNNLVINVINTYKDIIKVSTLTIYVLGFSCFLLSPCTITKALFSTKENLKIISLFILFQADCIIGWK